MLIYSLILKKVNNHITVHCNAGEVKVNMMGTLTGYGKAWYYPQAIANILSLFKVAQRFHVEYDSAQTGSLIVWKGDGTRREFKPGVRGLFYYDCTSNEETVLTTQHYTIDCVNTVKENMT